MRRAPRPLVDAIEKQLAADANLTLADFRRRRSERVAAVHALGAALDGLDGELDIRLRAAIAEYLG
ncbi:MAG: hypothetical protein ACRDQA_00280 [Nocardioidaceae bacterium]